MSVTTYSFLDLTGSINHPLVGNYLFRGQDGIGSVAVKMTTPKTIHTRAADGSIMVTKAAGENGQVTIVCQQTSIIHEWLLNVYNLLNFYPDTSKWALMSMMLRNVVDGSSHIASGMSFLKIPDKTYGADGATVTWDILAADIQNLVL
jgi:hypothetical protein